MYICTCVQYPSLNIHADVTSKVRDLNSGVSRHIHPYFVFLSSTLGETYVSLLCSTMSTKIKMQTVFFAQNFMLFIHMKKVRVTKCLENSNFCGFEILTLI